MFEKNQPKLLAVRGLLAAFTNELVANRRQPDEMLEDENALAVIRREAKKRREAIAAFRAGGREDLASNEEAELAYLNSLLPAPLSREEIKKVAAEKMAALNVTEKAFAGRLVGAVIKELRGRAEGKDVKEVVEEMLL